ncbi:MAG: type III pantothenate kinase [Bacteroidales bacterium]|nr:type III pantothenate kinase [Bacteroidales bacterium]MCF6341596.1 type III pantothenate kinase [Bacteroidales bacterium]
MQLVIDIGNSFVKSAVFDGQQMIDLQRSPDFTVQTADQLLNKYKGIRRCILSSVREGSGELESYLRKKTGFILLNAQTPLPFVNKYATPEKLGKDRLAAVAGAQGFFPGRNILVLDAGTSITYDLLNASGEYLGGGISPGIQMRFEALHTFTGRLPLVKTKAENEVNLIGDTTEKSILSGVLNGVLQEVDGIISKYDAEFSALQTLICGGDNKYFDKYLKNNIFAAPNLVLLGLMRILDFNEDT